jgi:hypothetical protein
MELVVLFPTLLVLQCPQDGSAPNLVVVSKDNRGQSYLKRAFNTQACEQLNAWLGGFESILKRMTPGNFNWFLHTMLFYHTRHVLERQNQRNNNRVDDSEDSDDSDEEVDQIDQGDGQDGDDDDDDDDVL